MHASMPKQDILAFNVTRVYTKFIWLIFSIIRQNSDIVLHTLEFFFYF